MCRYIKDDGEQCGRDTEPYCHQHEDTIQAALYERSEERFGNAVDGTLLPVFWKEIEDQLEAVTVPESDFTGQTREHTCDECEAPVRRCVANIEQSGYSPTMVEVSEGLTCDCGHFVQHDRVGGRIPKSEVPDSWV